MVEILPFGNTSNKLPHAGRSSTVAFAMLPSTSLPLSAGRMVKVPAITVALEFEAGTGGWFTCVTLTDTMPSLNEVSPPPADPSIARYVNEHTT